MFWFVVMLIMWVEAMPSVWRAFEKDIEPEWLRVFVLVWPVLLFVLTIWAVVVVFVEKAKELSHGN